MYTVQGHPKNGNVLILYTIQTFRFWGHPVYIRARTYSKALLTLLSGAYFTKLESSAILARNFTNVFVQATKCTNHVGLQSPNSLLQFTRLQNSCFVQTGL